MMGRGSDNRNDYIDPPFLIDQRWRHHVNST